MAQQNMTKSQLKAHIDALDNRLSWLVLKCAGLKSNGYGPLWAEKEATKAAIDLMLEKLRREEKNFTNKGNLEGQ